MCLILVGAMYQVVNNEADYFVLPNVDDKHCCLESKTVEWISSRKKCFYLLLRPPNLI